MDQNHAIHSQQSFRVNKWASSTPQDPARTYFKKYGDRRSKQFTVNSGVNQSINQYHTEFSQITNVVDNGFKRMKYNQMETLNQLRQQYQILRNLPIQEEMIHQTHHKKHSEGSLKQSMSSESKKSRKHHRDSYGKQMQMLGLEKRQLEIVIGNSMRKIEDLLNNQAEYKKIIHELQIKLDSRGSEDKLDGTVRNLKRNQIELNEKIENLKKQIERLKQLNRQLSQKCSSYESELTMKDQQIRRYKQERRRFEDQIRNQKDKNSQLEVDYKKLKVEYELLEKDKNSEINRLNKTISEYKNEGQNYLYKIRTLEEQIKSKESMIENLRQDIDRIRNRPQQKTKIIEKKINNEEQMTMLHTLIGHLKEESTNQNRASMDLITSILQNMQNKKTSPPPTPKNNDSGLLMQLENIKEQLYRLRSKKEESGSRVEYNNVSEYLTKISNLENDLADSELENLKLKDDNTNLRSSYEQMKEDLETIHKEYLELKSKLAASENSSFFVSENMKTQFRQREMGYEEQIRNLQKQLDQALFTADRERKDKQHTLNLLKTENSSAIRLLQQQLGKLEREKNELRGELDKMKAFYEAKLREKNEILEQMSKEKSILIQTHQKTLLTCKNSNEKQMGELLRKLHEMAEINDRYMKLSAQCSDYERQVHELRHYIRKFKVLNDNVDHLWMVKQAEYGNLHMLLDSIKTV